MKEGLGGAFKRTINIFALITRYFFGILFVIAGLSAIFIHKNGFDSLNFLSGLIFLMLGIALTPILNKYFIKAAYTLRDFYLKIDNQYNKHIKAYSLLLFLFFTIGLWAWLFSQFSRDDMSASNSNTESNSNIASNAEIEACTSRGISYFKEVGSYPVLHYPPEAGRSAEEVARERCNRTTTAFQ